MLEECILARSFKGFGEGRRRRRRGGRWEQLMVDDFPDTVRFLMGGVGWLSDRHDFM